MNVTTTEHAAQVTNLRGSLHWLCLPPFSTNIPVPTMHQVHTQLKAMSYHPAFPVGRAWSFTLITSSPDCHRSLFFTSSPYPKSIPPTNPMWTNNTSRRINRLLCNLEVWSLLKQIQTPASLGHFIFLWLKYTWYKMYSFHLSVLRKALLPCPLTVGLCLLFGHLADRKLLEDRDHLLLTFVLRTNYLCIICP